MSTPMEIDSDGGGAEDTSTAAAVAVAASNSEITDSMDDSCTPTPPTSPKSLPPSETTPEVEESEGEAERDEEEEGEEQPPTPPPAPKSKLATSTSAGIKRKRQPASETKVAAKKTGKANKPSEPKEKKPAKPKAVRKPGKTKALKNIDDDEETVMGSGEGRSEGGRREDQDQSTPISGDEEDTALDADRSASVSAVSASAKKERWKPEEDEFVKKFQKNGKTQAEFLKEFEDTFGSDVKTQGALRKRFYLMKIQGVEWTVEDDEFLRKAKLEVEKNIAKFITAEFNRMADKGKKDIVKQPAVQARLKKLEVEQNKKADS